MLLLSSHHFSICLLTLKLQLLYRGLFQLTYWSFTVRTVLLNWNNQKWIYISYFRFIHQIFITENVCQTCQNNVRLVLSWSSYSNNYIWPHQQWNGDDNANSGNNVKINLKHMTLTILSLTQQAILCYGITIITIKIAYYLTIFFEIPFGNISKLILHNKMSTIKLD